MQLVHLPAGDGPEAQRAALREHVGEDEYFLGLLPDGSQLVHRISRGGWPLAGCAQLGCWTT